MTTKNSSVLKTGLYICSYLLWMFTLFYLSLLPNLKGPNVEIPYFDKIVHFGFYFVASFLFLLLIEKTLLNKLRRNIKVFTTVILHLSLGILIEYIQHNFVSGRSGEMEDVVANLLGVLIAILVFYSKWNYFYRPN